ncbi:MAG TPA: sugar ABC transporter substrate-binding protein [Pseudolysinimonas sp.]|nr:sugar ABC transporter substrate-binding protein [Pseudolysinimonas sp.]
MSDSPSARRRAITALSAIGIVALAVSGCAPSSEPAPDPSDLAGQTIRMTVVQAGFRPAMEPAIARFTEETGIKVELVGYGGDQIQEKTQLEVSSRSSNIDVYALDGPPYMATMHDALEPLQPYVDRDGVDLDVYIPSMLEMGRYPSDFTQKEAGYKSGTGEVLGLPVRIGPHILHYRKDIFEQFGLEAPKTLDELREQAKTITEGTNGEVYGVALEGAQSLYIVLQWYDILWSFGADVFDETLTKATLDDPRAVEATEYFVNLYQDGYAPPSTPSADLDAAVALLQQGSAAMYPEYFPRHAVLNDPEASKTAGQWIAAPIPGNDGNPGVAVVTGWSLGVNKYSEHKDAAWELIKFLTSPEVQLSMAVENGNAPTVASVYEDAKYQELVPAAAVALEAAQSSKARSGLPGILEIEQTILAFELNAALVGDKTPAQAMKDAQQRITDVLK